MSFEETSNPQYSAFIHLSRYSRWLPEQGRREFWSETVQRYIDFFKAKHPNLAAEIQELYQPIHDLKVMPSMRAMAMAGKALEKDQMGGYNCAFLAIDHPRAFDEMLYALMVGTGVGFSVERQFISKLPDVAEEFHNTETCLIVRDSKIGWATSFRELISLLYAGQVPSWDLSRLRPYGARLKTTGGRSSGPDPLDRLFKFAVSVFKKAAGRKLSSTECHDLACMIGEIVVCGGSRRSALLSLSNVSDDRMRLAKSGQWWMDNPQRALANNSAAYTEKPEFAVFLKEWQSLYESKSGERGIFNRKAAQKQAGKSGRRDGSKVVGCNPCLSPDSMFLTPSGEVRMDKLSVGDLVWSGSQWTPLIAKWSTGVKPVYEYTVSNGFLLKATVDHKIVQRGEKIEISLASEIDLAMDPDVISSPCSAKIVSRRYVGDSEVFDFTVEADEHTAWVNGLLVGNCGEVVLKSAQTCNLSEIIVRPEDTIESLRQKATVAAILGTLQSALSDFRYVRNIWKSNVEEERLLGVSMTGITDHPLLGDHSSKELPAVLDELRQLVVSTNKEWAAKLGINPSAACTVVKPAGTVSQLTDSASGIHPRFARHYIRRVRADKKDPLAQMMRDWGFPCEDDSMNANAWIFSFPMKAPETAQLASEVTALDQLKLWKIYHDHWCEHNPSITVYYRDHEFLEVGNWVWNNFDDISGIAFLPYSDHTYVQAPYESITEQRYEELLKLVPKDVDWSHLSAYEIDDNTTGSQTLACTGNLCEVP